MTDFAAILDCYSLEDILNLNDITLEECLIFLSEEKFITLPDIQPMDFE